MKFNTYKNFPLVRKGNEMYYGYMSDPYVIWIQIISKTTIGNTETADKTRVTLMATDPKLNPLEACVKNMTCEGGLYEALDTAYVWLEKALKPAK